MNPPRPRAGLINASGLRARSTIAAVSVVAIALLFASLGLLAAVRWQWTSTLRDGLTERTREIASLLESDYDEGAKAIAAIHGDTTVVQVIDAEGNVVLASPGVAGSDPLVPTDPAAGPGSTTMELDQLGEGHYVVVTVPASSPDGPVSVIGATSLASVRDLTRTVVLAILIGVPLLLAVVAAVTWAAVGRSLGDVDRIRRRVEAIDARGLSDHVPVPPTGDEIAALAETMNLMLDRLHAAATMQQRFVADASHELRSPLASMRISLDVAAQADDLPTWQESAMVLGDEVDRMSRLVNDLLLLARADEGELRMHPRAVDLDEMLAAEARRLRAQTRLQVTADLEPLQVEADPQRLGQAVRNLLDNAARFARTRVHVATRLREGLAVIAVSDDGPGILPQQREEVLQRFVRLADDRARDSGGVGLGLAIAAEIARLHDGRLTVGDSELGGALFEIELPT